MLGFYRDYRLRNTYRRLYTAGEAPGKDAPFVYIGMSDIPAALEQEFND